MCKLRQGRNLLVDEIELEAQIKRNKIADISMVLQDLCLFKTLIVKALTKTVEKTTN